jgi:hypothetical protein
LENIRFCLPRSWEAPSTIITDLFALGSTIYEIMTGKQPYAELTDADVESNFRTGTFPSVDSIVCGELITQCWEGKASSAGQLQDSLAKQLINLST